MVLPGGIPGSPGAFARPASRRIGGAVPVYLGLIPAVAGPLRGTQLFAAILTVVIASLLEQGRTVAPTGRRGAMRAPAAAAVPPARC